MPSSSEVPPVIVGGNDSTLTFLREAARRRDSADVVQALRQLVLQCPTNWPNILACERGAWGDDGVFVMKHVVIRDGNIVTFERVDHGTS